MKLQEKIIAVQLRKTGFSYSKIFKKVRVSKSTLSHWLRDIELTSKQKEKILKGREKSRYAGSKAQQIKRIKVTEEITTAGKKEFYSLIKNSLFLAGLCLYWAEGDKHKQERVKFTNSDEKMISLMMRWFREICGVPEEKFRVALHIHNLHIAKNIKRYWSEITGVPEKQFQKIYIKQTTLRHRRNVLYNGTCAIVVHNKALFRRIYGWKLGLISHFNISPRSSMDRTKDF